MKTKVYVLYFTYYSFFGRVEEIAGVFSTKKAADDAKKELEKEFKESDHLSTSILVFELDKLQNTE